MVPARNTWVCPNSSKVYRWALAWYSPEKFRSMSGTLSPPKPRKVSKGMLKPSFTYLVPHTGQKASGMSAPQP